MIINEFKETFNVAKVKSNPEVIRLSRKVGSCRETSEYISNHYSGCKAIRVSVWRDSKKDGIIPVSSQGHVVVEYNGTLYDFTASQYSKDFKINIDQFPVVCKKSKIPGFIEDIYRSTQYKEYILIKD